ncbi:MAG: hypothetical protein D6696_07605, partial [Acidobacteria bacterium]
MRTSRPPVALALMTLVLALMAAPAARAQLHPSSDLLVPYFEVDLEGNDLTTLFAVSNSAAEKVPVTVRVHSNWGITLLKVRVTLEPDEVLSVNLRDWIVNGRLPDRNLKRAELDHLQAALSGERSPRDELFYSSATVIGRAVGYVTIRVPAGGDRPQSLWGDYFVVLPSQDFAQGDALVDVNRQSRCLGLCNTHGLRFLEGGAFDGGTELVVWTGKVLEPSPDPGLPRGGEVTTRVESYNQRGLSLGTRAEGLPPAGTLTVRQLGLSNPFGWVRINTDEEAFIGVRFTALNRFSVSLQSTCLTAQRAPGPGILVEKRTNGFDADLAPGPQLALGDAVTWTYQVTNVGDLPFEDVQVTDDDPSLTVSCPQFDLEPGESMTCTATGFVQTACQYRNVGTARGFTSDGVEVADTDASHFFGKEEASIELEKATNGADADVGPGPEIEVGKAITWTYVVTNTGQVAVEGVAVSDDDPALELICGKTALAPGESMTCTATGKAAAGPYKNVGTVTARTAGCGTEVRDDDPSHYLGKQLPPPPPPPPPP